MPKYHNRSVIIDGILFDSVHEARRYRELSLLLRAGAIADLKRQVHFELIPAQSWGTRRERPVTYIADFVYSENGETVVEDAKGVRTKDYIIKRKLMKQIHRIEIREV